MSSRGPDSQTRSPSLLPMRRVIGGVGRTFVTAGVLILLFVAYQLWGTGFLEARAQTDLRRDFERELDAGPTTTPAEPPTTAEPAPIPPDGEAVAIIRIPKIGVDKVVVEGTTVDDLRKGPGHYAGTPLPGQIGNAAIAGHRTTYGAPFENLDQLADGDTITVETLAGTFDYRVTSVARPGDEPPWEPVFVVNPSQTEVLEETPTQATLTLTTCNPKYSARERLIVKAEFDVRADQPQPQAPPTRADTTVGIDAGLSGDDASRLPTLLWGLVAAAVGALWWLVFHRYRRWTTWIAGAIPFVVALATFYYFLERLLPANY